MATAKTTLTVQVTYDPDKTDPESIASAADRLLETVLSTPGIMAEYGDPKFDEFYCPPISYAIAHLDTRELMLATYGMFSTYAAAQDCVHDADSRIADDLVIVTILGFPPSSEPDEGMEEKEPTFKKVIELPEVWKDLLAIEEFDADKVHRRSKMLDTDSAEHLYDPMPYREDTREVVVSDGTYEITYGVYSGDSNYWTDIQIRRLSDNVDIYEFGETGFEINDFEELTCDTDKVISFNIKLRKEPPSGEENKQAEDKQPDTDSADHG